MHQRKTALQGRRDDGIAHSKHNEQSSYTGGSEYTRQYNAQANVVLNWTGLDCPHLLWLLIPGMVLVSLHGGHTFLSYLAIGMSLGAVLEFADSEGAAFAVHWLTLILSIISLARQGISHAHSLLFTVLLTCTVSWVLLLAWMYVAILNSRFCQREFPSIMPFIRALLHATSAFPIAALSTAAITSQYGVDGSEYVLFMMLYIALRVTLHPLYIPIQIARIHVICFMILPSIFYTAVHHTGPELSSTLGLSSLGLLTSSAWLIMCLPVRWLARSTFMTSKQPDEIAVRDSDQDTRDTHPLWYPFPIQEAIFQTLISYGGIIATGICVWSLEHRVVFHVFSPYLGFAGTFAHAFMLATLLTAAGAGLLLIQYRQRRASPAQQRWMRILIGVASLSAAIAVSFPTWVALVWSAAVCASTELLLSRQLKWLLAGGSGLLVVLSWYMHHAYGFLDVTFSLHLSLQAIATIVVILAIMAFFCTVVGLYIVHFARNNTFMGLLCGLLFVAYALGLAFLELLLMKSNALHELPVYPAYVLVMTSVLGLVMTKLLHDLAPVPRILVSVSGASFLGKLTLLHAEGLLHLAAVILAIMPMFHVLMVYGYSSGTRVRSSIPQTRNNNSSGILPSLFSWFNAWQLFNAIFLLVARKQIFKPYTHGGVYVVPTLIIIASFNLWTALIHAPLKGWWRRGSALFFVLVILLTVIQPSQKDWLLFTGLAIVLFSTTIFSGFSRRLAAACSGALLGLYTCHLLLPYHALIWLLFVLAFVTTGLLIPQGLFPPKQVSGAVTTITHTMTMTMTTATTNILSMTNVAFIVLCVLFPVTMMTIDAEFGVPGTTASRQREYYMINKFGLFAIHAALHLLITASMKFPSIIHGFRKPSKRTRDAPIPPSSDIVRVMMANISCLVCVFMALYLHMNLLHGDPIAVIIVAPVLLFMQGFEYERRYFPVGAFIVGRLVLESIMISVWTPLMISLGLTSHTSLHLQLNSSDENEFEGDLGACILECIYLVCVMPLCYSLVKYLYYPSYLISNLSNLTLCVPLSLLTLLCTQLQSTWYVAVITLVGLMGLFKANSLQKEQGQRVI